jgi:hypothetical protein
VGILWFHLESDILRYDYDRLLVEQDSKMGDHDIIFIFGLAGSFNVILGKSGRERSAAYMTLFASSNYIMHLPKSFSPNLDTAVFSCWYWVACVIVPVATST